MTCSPEARKQVWALPCRQRPPNAVTRADLAMPAETSIQVADIRLLKQVVMWFFPLCWYYLNLLSLSLYGCRSVFYARAINNLCLLIARSFGGCRCTLRHVLAFPPLPLAIICWMEPYWASLFKKLIALRVLPGLCQTSSLHKHPHFQVIEDVVSLSRKISLRFPRWRLRL